MEKLARVTRHPAGRIGLALGFTAGFIAAFVSGARGMLLLVGLIAFWQHTFHFDVHPAVPDRKSTRLNSSHANISYAVFCLKKKKKKDKNRMLRITRQHNSHTLNFSL